MSFRKQNLKAIPFTALSYSSGTVIIQGDKYPLTDLELRCFSTCPDGTRPGEVYMTIVTFMVPSSKGEKLTPAYASSRAGTFRKDHQPYWLIETTRYGAAWLDTLVGIDET